MGAVVPKAQILFALLTLVAASSTFAQASKTRTVRILPGTPIVEMLRDDDVMVEVERGDVISVFVDDRVLSLSTDLDERVRFTDAIAVVEPLGSRSYLVENGGWIRSTLDLHMVKNLKGRSQTIFDRDGMTTIEHDGGELSLKGVRVRAGGYLLFQSGQRYLVSLKALANGKIAFVGMQFRLTADERIAPILLPDGKEATAPSPLYGLSLQALIEEIDRRVKRDR